MTLRYLDEPSAAGQAESDVPCLATAAVRDSFIIDLPKLSTRDAEAAACFKARAMYPGPADSAFFSARVFPSHSGTASLVHILPKAAIDGRSSAEIRYPVFTPMDLVPLDTKAERLFVFVFATCVEWLVAKDGTPVSCAYVSISELQGDKAAQLKLAIQRLPGLVLWAPAGMLAQIGGIESALGIDPKSCRVTAYEDAVPEARANGANAFGPRSRVRRRRYFASLLAAALLNACLLAAILARVPLAERREYGELKMEKTSLMKAAAQVAELKKEIALRDEEKGWESAEREDPYSVLEELARFLPSDCLIAAIDIQGSVFRLSGTAQNAYALISKLEQSGKFGGLSLEQAAPLAGGRQYKLTVTGSLRHD